MRVYVNGYFSILSNIVWTNLLRPLITFVRNFLKFGSEVILLLWNHGHQVLDLVGLKLSTELCFLVKSFDVSLSNAYFTFRNGRECTFYIINYSLLLLEDGAIKVIWLSQQGCCDLISDFLGIKALFAYLVKAFFDEVKLLKCFNLLFLSWLEYLLNIALLGLKLLECLIFFLKVDRNYLLKHCLVSLSLFQRLIDLRKFISTLVFAVQLNFGQLLSMSNLQAFEKGALLILRKKIELGNKWGELIECNGLLEVSVLNEDIFAPHIHLKLDLIRSLVALFSLDSMFLFFDALVKEFFFLLFDLLCFIN